MGTIDTNKSKIIAYARDNVSSKLLFDNLKQQFVLARLRTRFLARIIDLITVSIPTLIMFVIVHFTIGWKQKWVVILLVVVNLGWLICYFILLPIFWHGKTIGKKICKICVKGTNNDRKNFIIGIMVREGLIIFLPFSWNLGIYLGISFALNTVQLRDLTTRPLWVQILLKTGSSLLVIWYLWILIYAKISKNQQIFFDYHFHLLIVKTVPSPPNQPVTTDSDQTVLAGPGAVDRQALRQLPQ